MEDIKCHCGHANPVGTYLCEACGNPIGEEIKDNNAVLDMRYEGAARRSQTYNKTIVDKVWNFFSSVKIAVYMIIIVLLASILGTVFPQEMYIPVPKPANIYYAEAYGTLGELYYQLGFHNLYTSWWYVSLLLMIGISLVVCSIDRIIPLYKALKKQRVRHNPNFLTRQKLSTQIETPAQWSEKLEQIEGLLKKKRFQVKREGDALLAEKSRFSRWGPYVNHVGLIIFLIGVLLRLIPGFYLDQYVWVRDGEIKKVPDTDYYVKNEAFIIEYYADHEFPEDIGLGAGDKVVKTYKTKAVLYENLNAGLPGAEPKLEQVTEHEILVNHPLKYKDLQLFQSGQKPNSLSALNITLFNETTGVEIGRFKIDLYDPQKEYKINDEVTVKILEYFPDFEFTEDKKPMTKSTNPDNPAFILTTITPETPVGEKSWLFLGSYLPAPGVDNIYGFRFHMPDLTNITGLMVRKDKSLPLIYFGCFVTMIGLVMGFYWQHRRIWIQTEGAKVYLAGHTNKNWFGLKKEIKEIMDKVEVPVLLEEKGKGGKQS
ncbi:cytochrome c biogenesis protein ResB [Ammoniphilus sp. CFH 90114]|uniref:cytochrome c biogenesis protein ResB n=1 Tax=Ammoniphilus sp. CFH 90114 TaxID=2493665 RepID=UPI00100E88BE|nr:cytochrome c biogenesis protein ResB [Ammoniphilus sp. CFH 90114]RXT13855.1 cytochrome c biogenesis protein ResB [Ammoniphilus sp. CFH 90114]